MYLQNANLPVHVYTSVLIHLGFGTSKSLSESEKNSSCSLMTLIMVSRWFHAVRVSLIPSVTVDS